MNRKRLLLLVPLVLIPVGWFAITLLPEAPYKSLDNEGLAQMVRNGATVIDIRRPEEWRQTGVVEGSYLITAFDERGRMMPDFAARFGQLTDPNDPVVLICRTGNRTSTLARLLTEQADYQEVYNVSHGIVSWIAAGKDVKPCSSPGADLRC
jgi:rhodanese-related sulfurtransferase